MDSLEKNFDSIISKVPDLCKPPAFRLAGEEDYFNKTSKLKLKPFRKQEVFDRCLRATSTKATYSSFENISSTRDLRLCRDFDRLLFDPLPAANFPLANPIPECMLAKDNVDNLRDIIVSSLDIEWRMLTPVRPDNKYEEDFFDKLIYLHRRRYEFRLESEKTGDNVGGLPFRHTRHGLVSRGAYCRHATTCASPKRPSSCAPSNQI